MVVWMLLSRVAGGWSPSGASSDPPKPYLETLSPAPSLTPCSMISGNPFASPHLGTLLFFFCPIFGLGITRVLLYMTVTAGSSIADTNGVKG